MSGLEISSFVHLGWKKESGQRPAFYFYTPAKPPKNPNAVIVFVCSQPNADVQTSNRTSMTIFKRI